MMSKQGIKISVVIPVYNMQKCLGECISSVQNQTMKELEILCVDDGSTDDSQRILEKLQKTDSRIKVFKQTHHGAGAARNCALENANGEFVCFMDADDYWMDKQALETLYNSAVRQKVRVCGGQFYTDTCGNVKVVNIYGSLYQKGVEEALVRYAEYQYDYHYQNYIYERKMLIENHIKFPHYMRVEDTLFFVRAMAAAEVFCVVNIPFYCYRTGDKIVRYKENEVAEYLQGMIENLAFSAQKGLKKLHRIIYYRMLELCRREWKQYVMEGNAVLYQKLSMADAVIHWEWLEETCRIKERSLRSLPKMRTFNEGEVKEKWFFPMEYVAGGSRIALYGAGDVGRSYFRQIQKEESLCLCAWADKNYEKIADGNYKLISPQDLVTVDFDYIVIGVAEIVAAMEIMDNLAELGVPANKIVWDIGR